MTMPDLTLVDDCPNERRTSSCPRCGNARLDDRHCKLVCLNCGYIESCKDLFKHEPTGRESVSPRD